MSLKSLGGGLLELVKAWFLNLLTGHEGRLNVQDPSDLPVCHTFHKWYLRRLPRFPYSRKRLSRLPLFPVK